jgi:hypothetical protein
MDRERGPSRSSSQCDTSCPPATPLTDFPRTSHSRPDQLALKLGDAGQQYDGCRAFSLVADGWLGVRMFLVRAFARFLPVLERPFMAPSKVNRRHPTCLHEPIGRARFCGASQWLLAPNVIASPKRRRAKSEEHPPPKASRAAHEHPGKKRP